jgi:hypothetical protein
MSADACPADSQPPDERSCNLGPCKGLHFALGDWEIVRGLIV